MKFTDPLASLQYMGGAIPIHFALCIYAFYVYFDAYKKTNCEPIREIPEFQPIEVDAKN